MAPAQPGRPRLRYQYDRGLRRAATEAEVVAIVREYWAEVPKWVKCLVPRHCHRRPLANAANVRWWSTCLRHRFAIPSTFGDAARLRDLVDFLDQAAARLEAIDGARSSCDVARSELHATKREQGRWQAA
jgi:hypothetical protein